MGAHLCGHEMTPENTYRGTDGKRRCRTCIRDYERGRRGRRRRAAESRARPGFTGELLACLCWCEAHTVYIPAEWVWAGQTASCGPDCRVAS